MSTPGQTVTKLSQLKQQLKALTEQESDLRQEIAVAERALIDLMDDNEIQMTRAAGYNAVLNEVEVPTIEDRAVFLEWLTENIDEAVHLLQLRISSPAWREMRDQTGDEIPGTRPFLKRSISLRKA